MTALYPWLAPTYDKITQAFSQGFGHHALLFKADLGLGAEKLLNAVAEYLFCNDLHSELKPCQHCHACRLFSAGNHPDFHLLAPIDDKDIGVDQVRDINEKMAQHAQQGGNKVVLVQGADRLTEAAANALLKTLEEPRPNSYFLLQTYLSAPLLATIHSRCQTWLVTTPTLGIAQQWLLEQRNQQGKPDEIAEIHTALRMNYGRPLLALETLEQGLIEKRREFLRAFWVFYLRRSPLELLPLFDKNLIFQQLDWLCGFLSDALKDKLGIKSGWVSQDLARGVQQFSEKQTALGLLKANNIVQKARSDLAEISAVNQELILLDALTKLATQVFEP